MYFYSGNPKHSVRDYCTGVLTDAVALVIQRLFQDKNAAYAYVHRLDSGEWPEELTAAFGDTSAIIDASASVPVARSLAFDETLTGPVTSVFLNPIGCDGVLLTETTDRSNRIDCVEMHYYWMISSLTVLQEHLREIGKPLPVGGCRSPSARIPETQVALLSSIMAGRWEKDRDLTHARVSIWSGACDFDALTCVSEMVPDYLNISMGDWIVKISTQVLDSARYLRKEFSSKETGGIIAGSWDRQRKVIYVAGIYDAPPNSKHSNTEFVRGSVGIYKTITELQKATLNNLTYVGEWHSHPPGVSSNPSPDDKQLLNWIEDILVGTEVPAVMLIAADDGLRIILQNDEEVLECVVQS